MCLNHLHASFLKAYTQIFPFGASSTHIEAPICGFFISILIQDYLNNKPPLLKVKLTYNTILYRKINTSMFISIFL